MIGLLDFDDNNSRYYINRVDLPFNCIDQISQIWYLGGKRKLIQEKTTDSIRCFFFSLS